MTEKQKIVEALNAALCAAVEHGGDIGGPYFDNWLGFIEATERLLEVLGLEEYRAVTCYKEFNRHGGFVVSKDAAPERIARWLETRHSEYSYVLGEGVRWSVFTCSACGKKDMATSRYCPDCGARMEEDA